MKVSVEDINRGLDHIQTCYRALALLEVWMIDQQDGVEKSGQEAAAAIDHLTRLLVQNADRQEEIARDKLLKMVQYGAS